MQDRLALALARFDHRHRPALPLKAPGVAGLAAGPGVERRAVEHDAVRFDRDHGRPGLLQGRVVEEQALGHASHSARSRSRRAPSQSSAKAVTELA